MMDKVKPADLDSGMRRTGLFVWFAKNTSFHGLSRVVEGKNKVRRIAWMLAVAIAFIIVVCIISFRVADYFKYETVTDIKSHIAEKLDFPAVTVCNYNIIQKSSLSADQQDTKFDFPDEMADIKTVSCEPVACAVGEFSCNVAIFIEECCIPINALCDGRYDCFDWTDEQDCTNLENPSSSMNLPAPEKASNVDINTTIITITTPPGLMTPPGLQNTDDKPISDSKDSMLYFANVSASGWQLIDYIGDDPKKMTLLECVYNGESCSSEWFKKSITPVGNCYTFNHHSLVIKTNQEFPLVQRLSGPGKGLKLVINIQSYEYTSDYHYVGAKVFIHPRDEEPDLTQEGVSVPPGLFANIPFSKNNIRSHAKPWGNCDPYGTLKLSNQTYTRTACAEECRTLKIKETCNCQLYYSNLAGVRRCDDMAWSSCVKQLIDDINGKFSDYCDCPLGCYDTEYRPQVSYLGMSQESNTVMQLNIRYFNGTLHDLLDYGPTFYKDNVVGLRLYYGSMLETNITERKALDEISLISEIGGQLGLFVGVSVLTFCEILEALILACSRRQAPTDD